MEGINIDKIKCKRCSMEEILSFEEIKAKIPEFLANIDEDGRVSDEEYAGRLKLCFECEGLAFGVACKYCGCFIQIRALNKFRHCPSPVNKAW